MLNVPPTAERLTSMVQSAGLELDVRWSSTNMETIRSLVGRGLGFSFVNSAPATGATFDGLEVIYVPVDDEIPQNAVVAVLPAGHTPPRRIATALELLREDAQSQSPQIAATASSEKGQRA